MKGWAKAVSIAREQGLTPGDCHTLINFALSRPLDYWSDRATAIYLRLTTAQRDQSHSDGWLPVSANFKRRERVAGEKVVREAEQQQARYDACQRSAERAKREELEDEFGPYLDSLSRVDVGLLAQRIFAGNSVMFGLFKRKGVSGLVRIKLLEAVRDERSVTSEV